VIKLTFGQFSAILPGDIEQATETRLANDRDIDVDVLLASHPGSRGANIASYLAQVFPEVVIVYAGANNVYGHPHPEATARMEEKVDPMRAFRTDLHGDIVVVSNSTHYEIAVSSSDQVVVIPEFHELLVLALPLPLIATVIIMTRVMKNRWPQGARMFG
jgi:competence protein ComEC